MSPDGNQHDLEQSIWRRSNEASARNHRKQWINMQMMVFCMRWNEKYPLSNLVWHWWWNVVGFWGDSNRLVLICRAKRHSRCNWGRTSSVMREKQSKHIKTDVSHLFGFGWRHKTFINISLFFICRIFDLFAFILSFWWWDCTWGKLSWSGELFNCCFVWPLTSRKLSD